MMDYTSYGQADLPPCAVPLFDPLSREQWIPLTELEAMQRVTYDVLIVGTGAGGGAALWRLVQQLEGSGKRIGVLERGGLLLPTHVQNIETMTINRVFSYYGSSASYPRDYTSGQIYAVGGRTLFWSVTSPRFPENELAEWPIALPEMQRYYNLAEKEMSVTTDFTRDSPMTQILLKRLQRSGIHEAVEEPLAINLNPVSQFGVMNSNPFFSSIRFLAQALNGSYDLAIHARVVQVLTYQGRCLGVDVVSPDKRRHIIRAHHVVLAASTFGSAQILLNSNISGSAIGHYLTNHSRVMGVASIERTQFPEVLGPLRILVPGNEKRPFQIQIIGPGDYPWTQYAVQPLQPYWNFHLVTLGRVESRYSNYVELDPTKLDEDGVPELVTHFSYSNQDEEIFGLMAEGVASAAAAMKTALVPTSGAAICRMDLGSDLHEMGTCRMGVDPRTSVTNPYGQVHGIKGLYVADNSVLPTSGTANPTLTTVALAMRTADVIARRLK